MTTKNQHILRSVQPVSLQRRLCQVNILIRLRRYSDGVKGNIMLCNSVNGQELKDI